MKEDKVWAAYRNAGWFSDAPKICVRGVEIDLQQSWMAIGGRNGVGKTRFLRQLEADLPACGETEGVVFFDAYSRGESILDLLRKRTDLDEMVDEVEPLVVSADLLESVRKCVGKSYEKVEWFEFELDLSDEVLDLSDEVSGPSEPTPPWMDFEGVVPYFRVTYGGVEYGSLEMGRGEFSLHLVWWMLNRLRESPRLTLLLDEPDTFIPPDASETLLRRMLMFGKEREWRILLTSHSREVYDRAVEQGRFLALSSTAAGGFRQVDPWSEGVRRVWHPRPKLKRVVFVEDESAYHLMRALLRHAEGSWLESSLVTWLKGSGDMVKLRQHWPARRQAQLAVLFAFDGDKTRPDSDVPPTLAGEWPTLFLPTCDDPDDLFMSLSSDPDVLADRLPLSSDDVYSHLDEYQAEDSHDWVNKLAELGERTSVLSALADAWVAQNGPLANVFVENMKRECQ